MERLVPNANSPIRPVIFDYRALLPYLQAMIQWRKGSDSSFSIRRETAKLRRCSPALVTQVLKGKRKLTPERVEDFAQLFKLTPEEKNYLEQWVSLSEVSDLMKSIARPERKRKEGQNHLLSNWLNVYIKDACRLKGFREDPMTIYRLLGGIASPNQIERSLRFLLHEGFLRRTLDGRIVENDLLVTTTDEIPDKKIKEFHRKALEIAKRGMNLYPVSKRRQSALVLALNESSLEELKQVLKEFYEKLLAFAEQHPKDDEQLYQVIINLCPIGGESDPKSH